jgi:hypothetical protein
MIGRYIFSIIVGSVITLSLIFVMHLLIEHAEDAVTTERTKHQLDFVRVRRNETLNTEDFTPEKPPQPPETPPEVPPQDMDSVDPSAPTVNVPPPSVDSNVELGGASGMNVAEGDYLPIVRFHRNHNGNGEGPGRFVLDQQPLRTRRHTGGAQVQVQAPSRGWHPGRCTERQDPNHLQDRRVASKRGTQYRNLSI